MLGGDDAQGCRRAGRDAARIALCSLRSERQFCERLQYDLPFTWFPGLNITSLAFDPSAFSKNRARLLEHEVAQRFCAAVVAEARRRRLLSAEHSSVDDTLLDAWASRESFRPQHVDRKPPRRRPEPAGGLPRGAAHQRDPRPHPRPRTWLARKGPWKETKLAGSGQVLMEDRYGLVVDVALTQATGTAERDAGLTMLGRLPETRRVSVGAGNGYATSDFVAGCQGRDVIPHVTDRVHPVLDRRPPVIPATPWASGCTSEEKRSLAE